MGRNGWHEASPDIVESARAEARSALFGRLEALFAVADREPTVTQIDSTCEGDLGGLFAWCSTTFRFLLVTEELADVLADHLRRSGAARCVEVGAGRGELTGALRRRGINCIASDDRSWAVRKRAPGGIYGAHVLDLPFARALEHLQPDTVLCAWMPNGEDWSSGFRSARAVHRYILFGAWPDGHEGTAVTWAEHVGWRRTVLSAVASSARCRLDALLGTEFARLRTTVVEYSL